MAATILGLALLLALGYGAVLGALYLGQRRLIYLPDRVRPEPARAGVAEMTPLRLVTADGLALLAWYAPPAPGRAHLVYFHGNAGHLGQRGAKARPYLDRGYGVLMPAYRGYSGNPGRPSEAGLYADAEAAIGFLAARGVPARSLVLYGESLGAGVAVEMATRHPVGAVVLEAPPSSVADVGRHRFPLFPVGAIVKDRFDSVAKIGRVEAPILIVHGERDRTVPARLARRLFEAARAPREARFIEGAHHNDLYDFGMGETVLDFLARHLPAEPAGAIAPRPPPPR